MSDETRKPKFEFMPTARTYGKLDLQYELIVCAVFDGRLIERHYPKSWEEGVIKVGTREAALRLSDD